MFKSKKEFAQALIDGRKFKYKGLLLYYDENQKYNPFYCETENFSSRMSTSWCAYKSKDLVEIKEWYDNIPKEGIWCWVWNNTQDKNKAVLKVIEYKKDPHIEYRFKTTFENKCFIYAEPIKFIFS